MKISYPRSFIALIIGLLTAIPLSLFAQQNTFSSFGKLITDFTDNVVVALGGLFMAGAVVVFFLGVVQYIWGQRKGDGNQTKVGSSFMLWGLVALFVMFSVYGIVKFGQKILLPGEDVTTITIPKIKFENSGPTGSACSQIGCSPNGQVCALPNGAQGICRNSVCCTK